MPGRPRRSARFAHKRRPDVPDEPTGPGVAHASADNWLVTAVAQLSDRAGRWQAADARFTMPVMGGMLLRPG